MEQVNKILLNRKNVNVDKYINNNVYDVLVAKKIQDAIDKPKAIGEILVEKLGAPQNLRLYIKLSYEYSVEVLFRCLALTEEAFIEGRVRTDKARYFYGIVRKQKK